MYDKLTVERLISLINSGKSLEDVFKALEGVKLSCLKCWNDLVIEDFSGREDFVYVQCNRCSTHRRIELRTLHVKD